MVEEWTSDDEDKLKEYGGGGDVGQYGTWVTAGQDETADFFSRGSTFGGRF
jgi:hypothetical protein